MPDVVIMTDTNSGMSVEEGKQYGIAVLPMSFIINGKIYYEGLDISHKEFFDKLEAGAEVSTSQPSPGEVLDMWDMLLKRHDQVVHITMSGGLSKSYETAAVLAQDYDGKVQVVDSKRVSVPQKQLVMDAWKLAQEGKNAQEIKEELDKIALSSVIYITVDTLKYLKKGGRITGTAAVVGTVLNVKPILQVRGDKLDAYEKSRGMKAARRIMISAIQKEIEDNFAEEAESDTLGIYMAYTCMDEELVKEWEEQIKEAFPQYPLHADKLSLSTACHIGPGGLGIAVCKMINTKW